MTQKRKKISIIQRIIERIFGKKFYIAVVAQNGTNAYFVNSTIFRTEEEAKAHKRHVKQDCPSLHYICYYSFRSHNDFRLFVGNDVEDAKKASEE